MRPKARRNDLVIREIGDETMVYDLHNDRAHCLSPLAVCVWKHCDGSIDPCQLLPLVRRCHDTGVEQVEIDAVLNTLFRAGLVDQTSPEAGDRTYRSRRRILTAAAAGALAVATIVAPTPAQAQSQGFD